MDKCSVLQPTAKYFQFSAVITLHIQQNKLGVSCNKVGGVQLGWPGEGLGLAWDY